MLISNKNQNLMFPCCPLGSQLQENVKYVCPNKELGRTVHCQRLSNVCMYGPRFIWTTVKCFNWKTCIPFV